MAEMVVLVAEQKKHLPLVLELQVKVTLAHKERQEVAQQHQEVAAAALEQSVELAH